MSGRHIIGLEARSLVAFFFGSVGVKLFASVPKDRTYVIRLDTTNGAIYVSSLRGEEPSAQTSNGRINLKEISFGSINAWTTNGYIDARLAGKRVTLTTTNGSVDIVALGPGFYDVGTTNGRINVEVEVNCQ